MTIVTEASAPVDEAIADVEEQMGLLFNRARLVWKEAAQKVHPDLQPAAYKLLSTIVRLGSANAHVLAEMFEMDKSVVSRQVRALEEFGLVDTRADEHDGRVRVLVATPTAIERVREVREGNQQRLRDVLLDYPESDLRGFAELLRRIVGA
ncbi:DNA-binding MarR family transcriptional regulator [Agromyces terreus]|uniref:DNA-binding MarR family transcriptional regulator n=1 Tax=Agromyces terreus TaxID=424795 RepID=A0A9X2KDQ8_9MICO|nr:MarR family winged helix-turn-helix transcriptional regulator [Agromyces terreus]MCP2369822.1 DNA-binding MarR family transcriptional regulator [Agromyces terreus]